MKFLDKPPLTPRLKSGISIYFLFANNCVILFISCKIMEVEKGSNIWRGKIVYHLRIFKGALLINRQKLLSSRINKRLSAQRSLKTRNVELQYQILYRTSTRDRGVNIANEWALYKRSLHYLTLTCLKKSLLGIGKVDNITKGWKNSWLCLDHLLPDRHGNGDLFRVTCCTMGAKISWSRIWIFLLAFPN